MSIISPITSNIARAITSDVIAGSLTQRVQRIYSGGLAGLMYDMTLAANLFQDSARTIPVSAVSDPIGSATDLSGNNLHASIGTDSKRPIFNNYATFDGTDDALSVASLNLSSTDKITIVALLYWNTVTPTATIAEFSAAVGVGNPGSFAMQVEGNPYPLRVRLAGNSAVAIRTETTPIPAVPRASVITISLDIAGADIASEIGVRVNGAAAPLVSTGVTAGGGNFGSYAFHLAMRAAATLPWPGRIYRYAIFGKTLSSPETSLAEAWAGEPIGFIK